MIQYLPLSITEKREREMEGKGRICVTGGTGFVASWMILRLLDQGFSVHTTIRHDTDGKKDVSFLTNLPGASQRLKIFEADLSKPETFKDPIKGCTGVFHVAHPMDFGGKEPEQVQTKRSVTATIGILQACLESKTVKRVVYTSSGAAVVFNGTDLEVMDEEMWSDVDYINNNFKDFGAPYFVSKTLTEKAALEFAKNNGLDLVTVIPTFIHGPFVCPHVPATVRMSMAMIFGDIDNYSHLVKTSYVHVDDVARAHIFLLEYPDAKGRYNCSAVEITIEKMYEFLSARYPELQIPIPTTGLKMVEGFKYPKLSSKKLLETGFKYKYGLEEMFDEAIECCKQKEFLELTR